MNRDESPPYRQPSRETCHCSHDSNQILIPPEEEKELPSEVRTRSLCRLHFSLGNSLTTTLRLRRDQQSRRRRHLRRQDQAPKVKLSSLISKLVALLSLALPGTLIGPSRWWPWRHINLIAPFLLFLTILNFFCFNSDSGDW